MTAPAKRPADHPRHGWQGGGSGPGAPSPAIFFGRFSARRARVAAIGVGGPCDRLRRREAAERGRWNSVISRAFWLPRPNIRNIIGRSRRAQRTDREHLRRMSTLQAAPRRRAPGPLEAWAAIATRRELQRAAARLNRGDRRSGRKPVEPPPRRGQSAFSIRRPGMAFLRRTMAGRVILEFLPRIRL